MQATPLTWFLTVNLVFNIMFASVWISLDYLTSCLLLQANPFLSLCNLVQAPRCLSSDKYKLQMCTCALSWLVLSALCKDTEIPFWVVVYCLFHLVAHSTGYV